MKERELTVTHLEGELQDTKDKYESFDIRFKKKEKECLGFYS